MRAIMCRTFHQRANLIPLREQMKGVLLRPQDNLKFCWLECGMITASCNLDNELLNAGSS